MTDQATTAVMIQTVDDPWALTSRQDARRSHLYDLVERNQDSPELRAEINAALTPELRELFSQALAGVEAQLALPTETEAEILVAELTKSITLIGGSGTADWRAEWITVALEELVTYPASLVIAAVDAARKRVRYANEFVPWVIEYLSDGHRRLVTERDQLLRLRAEV